MSTENPIPLATNFESLGLSNAILKTLAKIGYDSPTPIQSQSIPIILSGRDLIGASQTGTGKTAAFALPTLCKVKPKPLTQVLVLEPTRELCNQVAEAFVTYKGNLPIQVAELFGGVGYDKQIQALKGAQVIIATPGRLMDHFYQGNLRFKHLTTLILDEVDRMLDMGFLPSVRKIVNLCPSKERQTLFFSATMPAQIKSFSKWCLTDPSEIHISRISVAETISHSFYPVSMNQRNQLLLALIKQTAFSSMIVFTRTKKEADQVHLELTKDSSCKASVIHSDIVQNQRLKALKSFKDGKVDILVATDVIARGIDISRVSHVLNYRVPENPEDYVHRIGRTGRAKQEGEAMTILTADELDFAKSIELLLETSITRSKLEEFAYEYTALLDEDLPKARKKNSSCSTKKTLR